MYLFSSNIDLFIVGFVLSTMLVMGSSTLFSDKTNASNKSFFLFCVVSVLWSIVNLVAASTSSVLAVRGTMLLGLIQVFALAVFLNTFPGKEWPFTPLVRKASLLAIFLVGCITLSSLTVARMDVAWGGTQGIITGPGVFVFALAALICIIVAIAGFVNRVWLSGDAPRTVASTVSVGLVSTFLLLVVFNFIFPAFLHNASFVRLGAVFLLPLILSFTLVLSNGSFLNVKAFTASLFVILMSTAVLMEIFTSSSIYTLSLRIAEFVVVLVFGVLLLRSVISEVKRREELERVTQELRNANDKLIRIDKDKDAYLSFAAHQMRGPLTGIRGVSSMMLDGSYGELSPKVMEGVKMIFDVGTLMVYTVSDFLDVSRMDDGKLTVTLVGVNFADVVRKAYGMLATVAERKGLKISLDVHGDDKTLVLADADKLEHIVANLIDNAIKYTQAGTVQVIVRVGVEGKIWCEVKDTGMGMEPSVISSLFQRWGRADSATKSGISGSGIGLYLAQMLAKAQNAEIRAESAGPQRGSTFTLEIGIAPPGTKLAPPPTPAFQAPLQGVIQK